jgi:hypothetical protein
LHIVHFWRPRNVDVQALRQRHFLPFAISALIKMVGTDVLTVQACEIIAPLFPAGGHRCRPPS